MDHDDRLRAALERACEQHGYTLAKPIGALRNVPDTVVIDGGASERAAALRWLETAASACEASLPQLRAQGSTTTANANAERARAYRSAIGVISAGLHHG